MTELQAIVLGIVEGLTEFLPISSTGHLILVSHYLDIIQNDQFIVFEIAIQLGAILAVVLTYFKKFFNLKLLSKLFVAFLPTGILGVLVFPYIKILLTSEYIVAMSLILGGMILIIVEKFYKIKVTEGKSFIEEIDYKKAFFLGLAQSLAMVPGVSRSGAVIVLGLFMNLKRTALVEFTFLLAVPTMCAATLYSMYKHKEILTFDYLNILLIGSVSSFLVALLVIRLFLNYIKKYDFVPFGIYRILLGIIVLLVLI